MNAWPARVWSQPRRAGSSGAVEADPERARGSEYPDRLVVEPLAAATGVALTTDDIGPSLTLFTAEIA